MKNSKQKLLIPAIFIIVMALTMNEGVLGQPPPPAPDNAGNGHNSNGNKGANAAPVGDGIWVLITLAISYGLANYVRKNERKSNIQPDMIEIKANENFDQESLKAVEENKVYTIDNEA